MLIIEESIFNFPIITFYIVYISMFFFVSILISEDTSLFEWIAIFKSFLSDFWNCVWIVFPLKFYDKAAQYGNEIFCFRYHLKTAYYYFKIKLFKKNLSFSLKAHIIIWIYSLLFIGLKNDYKYSKKNLLLKTLFII